MRRYWPLLIPVVAAAIVLALQPADQLGISGEVPHGDRTLYDDADMAAFTLRGINANLGRKPGPTEPKIDAEIIGGFVDNLRRNNHPPLLDRYFLEYPHAALFLFRGVMKAIPVEGSWPSTVLDYHYANIIFYHPQTDDEQAMWSTFRRAARVFAVINVLALLVMITVLIRGLGRNGEWSGPAWLLALPASLYFTMGRFDVLPSLFVVLGLAAAARKRPITSGFCLGFATALKLYPLVIAPLVWRHMTTEMRTGVKWALGFLLPLAAIFGTAISLDGLDGVLAPFKFQLGRPLEKDWVLYGRLLPMELATSEYASYFRIAILGLVAAPCFLLRPKTMDSLLRRCAIVLIVFASLQQFFSPQWLLWFVPLLVPLARKSWVLLILLVLFDVLTYVTFPIVYDQMTDDLKWLQLLLIVTRGLLMLAFLLWLAWGEFLELLTLQPTAAGRDA